jgi:hypothetical protein
LLRNQRLKLLTHCCVMHPAAACLLSNINVQLTKDNLLDYHLLYFEAMNVLVSIVCILTVRGTLKYGLVKYPTDAWGGY